MTMPPDTSNPPPSTDPPPSYDSQTTTHPPPAPRLIPQSPQQTPPSHPEPLPPYTQTTNRWAPYATEEEYLTALRAWAEEKTFVRLDERTALDGFYGRMTMREYGQREGGGWRADGGKRRKEREGRKGKEEGKERREEGKEKGKEKRGWFRRRGNKSGDGGV